MEHPSRKEQWEQSRRQKLGAQTIWDSVREGQIRRFSEMTPEQLASQSGKYDILAAQQVCSEKLSAAIETGDQEAIEAWTATAQELAGWREEYYAQSQRPSRFSSWAAQSQASRPVYNPRSRF